MEHAELFLANIGFWGSLGFYNAFLPEIAPREEHDKLSAKGYAWATSAACCCSWYALV